MINLYSKIYSLFYHYKGLIKWTDQMSLILINLHTIMLVMLIFLNTQPRKYHELGSCVRAKLEIKPVL